MAGGHRKRNIIIASLALGGVIAAGETVSIVHGHVNPWDNFRTSETRGPALPQAPQLPPDPSGAQFTKATMTYFNNGTKIPSYLAREIYDYPTTKGGTYRKDLVGVDTKEQALVLSTEVLDPASKRSQDLTLPHDPDKDHKTKWPNELPGFFTGTTKDIRDFSYGEYSVLMKVPVEKDAAGNIVQQHKPVLMLWAQDEEGNGWYHNVEIDIAEFYDRMRANPELNVQWEKPGEGQTTTGTSYPIDPDGYNWYSVRVIPGDENHPASVHIYINGIELTDKDGNPFIKPEMIPHGVHHAIFQIDQDNLAISTREPHPPRPGMLVKAIAKRDVVKGTAWRFESSQSQSPVPAGSPSPSVHQTQSTDPQLLHYDKNFNNKKSYDVATDRKLTIGPNKKFVVMDKQDDGSWLEQPKLKVFSVTSGDDRRGSDQPCPIKDCTKDLTPELAKEIVDMTALDIAKHGNGADQFLGVFEVDDDGMPTSGPQSDYFVAHPNGKHITIERPNHTQPVQLASYSAGSSSTYTLTVGKSAKGANEWVLAG